MQFIEDFLSSQMRCVVILLWSIVIFVGADRHLNANGPFGKRHTMDSELGHVHPCHRGKGIPSFSSSSISDAIVTIPSLNVTTTVYSNGEQINVSWTSMSFLCKDDFVGIYFIETPLSAGKYFLSFDALFI
jgi:hypothetical protein